jgi:hypothetical protein
LSREYDGKTPCAAKPSRQPSHAAALLCLSCFFLSLLKSSSGFPVSSLDYQPPMAGNISSINV